VPPADTDSFDPQEIIMLPRKTISQTARRLAPLATCLLALICATFAPNPAWAQHRWGGPHYWGGPYYRGGFFVGVLPAFATVLTIGALTYWYADGVYYRSVPGGYVEVPPPTAQPGAVPASDRLYIYPRQGQSAEKQASDEYDCHRWSVGQSGVDPSAGTGTDPAKKADYQRAQTACLEGRGYTVR
jgi:hypothetical protein